MTNHGWPSARWVMLALVMGCSDQSPEPVDFRVTAVDRQGDLAEEGVDVTSAARAINIAGRYFGGNCDSLSSGLTQSGVSLLFEVSGTQLTGCVDGGMIFVYSASIQTLEAGVYDLKIVHRRKSWLPPLDNVMVFDDTLRVSN